MDLTLAHTNPTYGSDVSIIDVVTTPSTGTVTRSSAVFFTRTFWFSIILVVFNVTALLLNGFVIYVVARYKDMRNTVTLCFVNLAITDVSLVVFSMSSSLRRTTGIDIQAITGCVAPVYFHAVSLISVISYFISNDFFVVE